MHIIWGDAIVPASPCQPPQRVVMCGTLFLFARPYEMHMTPIKQAEAFVAATGAQIDHGGTRAF